MKPDSRTDFRYQFQWLNAEPPILNVGCESDPARLWLAPGTVNADIDDWSGATPGFRQLDATVAPWPFANNSFDTVVFGDSLDHMEHPEVALSEARRVARRAVVLSLPKDAPTPAGDAYEPHLADLRRIGLRACAPGDLHRRHAHFEHWTEDRVRALLRDFDPGDVDLGSIPSGPPADLHWYWGAVVRLDAVARCAALVEQRRIDLPSVSILCATYRPGGLDLLFAGLRDQRYAGPWELVLVDELHAVRRDLVADMASKSRVLCTHVPNDRTLHPRDSTGRAHNAAIVAASGELCIWLMDYALVPRHFVAAHVEEHLAYEALTGRRDLNVNGAFLSVWPPRRAPRLTSMTSLDATSKDVVRDFPLSIFETTPSRELVEALPLTNRCFDADGAWTRTHPNLSQDEASLCFPEGWAGHGYYFMKHDSIRREWLLRAQGNDEAFDGLHCGHDTELALRLAALGVRFVHSKRAVVRVVQVRHLMKRLEAPPEAQARGALLLEDTRRRIADGDFAPRETHPKLRGAAP
mgnify:FL=1